VDAAWRRHAGWLGGARGHQRAELDALPVRRPEHARMVSAVLHADDLVECVRTAHLIEMCAEQCDQAVSAARALIADGKGTA
jgi:hypothetical protein